MPEPRILAPSLPYGTRLRLAAVRRIDLLGAWLCDHGQQRAASRLWRIFRMI
jgi:hypothetical protein